MNKKGRSIFSIVIILIALTIGLAVTSQVGFDIDKFKTDLKWKDIKLDVPNQPELGNALTYYVNGLAAAYFEMMKWVAQWSYENPNIPYKLLIIFLFLTLVAPVIILVFKILIIIFLLTKEFVQSRKEKRLLNMKGGLK